MKKDAEFEKKLDEVQLLISSARSLLAMSGMAFKGVCNNNLPEHVSYQIGHIEDSILFFDNVMADISDKVDGLSPTAVKIR